MSDGFDSPSISLLLVGFNIIYSSRGFYFMRNGPENMFRTCTDKDVIKGNPAVI